MIRSLVLDFSASALSRPACYIRRRWYCTTDSEYSEPTSGLSTIAGSPFSLKNSSSLRTSSRSLSMRPEYCAQELVQTTT